MYSYNWLFSWQNKNTNEKSSSGLLFTAEILQEAMYFTSPYLGQITKFNPKMQVFKRVLDLNCKQNKDWTNQFFQYWLSNVHNLVLSNGFEYVQNVIQWR